MRKKPEMVLKKGKLEFEGSSGDYYFEFRNGGDSYKCSINFMGPGDIPLATLTIKKGGKVKLSQNAKIIRKWKFRIL